MVVPISRLLSAALLGATSVVIAGCTPVWIAYCSAGSPNASHPIGCSTLNPFIRLYREMMSVAVYPSGCPT